VPAALGAKKLRNKERLMSNNIVHGEGVTANTLAHVTRIGRIDNGKWQEAAYYLEYPGGAREGISEAVAFVLRDHAKANGLVDHFHHWMAYDIYILLPFDRRPQPALEEEDDQAELARSHGPSRDPSRNRQAALAYMQRAIANGQMPMPTPDPDEIQPF
jgi:hypothetical protein